mmetsp:Transcript_12287/g.18849  ORF Transcript_12287/g.18849 Transcript_12287/m.18849 type:complete len:85 (+) Transcript_12287:1899-2153(+)
MKSAAWKGFGPVIAKNNAGTDGFDRVSEACENFPIDVILVCRFGSTFCFSQKVQSELMDEKDTNVAPVAARAAADKNDELAIDD